MCVLWTVDGNDCVLYTVGGNDRCVYCRLLMEVTCVCTVEC